MIHEDLKNRIYWFRELWEFILKQVNDVEIAKAIYKRILFEEQLNFEDVRANEKNIKNRRF